jgi:transposase
MGIIKAGNVYLRNLLIECANNILRPQEKDLALRRWGLHLAARGGKPAKNRAVVAVTRKPAVLLHRIWTAQESYVPFYAEVA